MSGGIIAATVNGLTTAITLDTPTDSVPVQMTVGSLNQNMAYNTFLGSSNGTPPNGASTSFTYDSAATYLRRATEHFNLICYPETGCSVAFTSRLLSWQFYCSPDPSTASQVGLLIAKL